MSSEALKTALGLRTIAGRRSSNEDAVLAAPLPDGREVIAIADGMGGHQAGEIASQSALQMLYTTLKAGATLQTAVAAANTVVYRAAQENSAWSGMGTTLVALLRDSFSYQIASVGDSRAYRITSTSVEQITRDHCLLADAVAAGSNSVEAVRHSRWKNALTRSIGGDATVEVDVFGPFDLKQSHTVVLCTDGLHGAVSDQVMRRCLLQAPDPTLAAQRLSDEAYRSGSTDNISVAVMVFGAQEQFVAKAADHQRHNYPLIVMPTSHRHHRTSWLQRLLTRFS